MKFYCLILAFYVDYLRKGMHSMNKKLLINLLIHNNTSQRRENIMSKSILRKRNLKRFRSILVTMALVVLTNIAISYASNGTSKSGAAVLPDSPRPKSGAAVLPDSPRPKSGAAVLPDSPRP